MSRTAPATQRDAQRGVRRATGGCYRPDRRRGARSVSVGRRCAGRTFTWRPARHSPQSRAISCESPGPEGPFFCTESGHTHEEADHERDFHAAQVHAREDPQHRDHGPHRRGQDDDDRAHPLLHRPHPQDGRGPRGRRRRWTGWSRSRSAASRSRPPRPPASGTTTGSTSSTRPATSTSRSRSSARCASSTARSRVRLRRRRRAAVRDRLAPGRQVPRPAHRLHQQDGPHRRRLRAAACRR